MTNPRVVSSSERFQIAMDRCAGKIDPPGFRRIERLDRTTGTWEPTLLCKLKVGDRYRMFETDGSPVTEYGGCGEFTAAALPSITSDERMLPGGWELWADIEQILYADS